MFKGLKSLLAGLLGGAALGILFAPKKGEELRKDIKNEVDSGGSGMNTVKNTVVLFSLPDGNGLPLVLVIMASVFFSWYQFYLYQRMVDKRKLRQVKSAF